MIDLTDWLDANKNREYIDTHLDAVRLKLEYAFLRSIAPEIQHRLQAVADKYVEEQLGK